MEEEVFNINISDKNNTVMPRTKCPYCKEIGLLPFRITLKAYLEQLNVGAFLNWTCKDCLTFI